MSQLILALLVLLSQFAGGARLSGVNLAVQITVPTANPTFNAGTATSITVGGTAASDRTVNGCTWTNSLGGSGTATGTTSWTIPNLPLTIGANAITVTCTNLEGTSTQKTITITTVPFTPTLVSLTPNTGPIATSIVIAGTHLGATQGTSTLTFNGTSATPTAWADTSVTAPVPAGATTGNVIATVNALASNALTFTVTSSAPVLTSLSPSTGLVAASITVNGTGFGATQGASTIRFNGTLATPTGWTATVITVPVPAGATTGNVIVTVGGQASNGLGFTVLQPPTLVSLTPTSGPIGVAVTVAGTNFGPTQGTSSLTFNGVAATPSSWAPTQIVAPVPAAATTGPVRVTVNGLNTNTITFTVTQVFFVDNASGHNCSDAVTSGSSTTPFCTFQYGVTHIPGSATLYVHTGTYTGDFTITGPSGIAGAHTVLSAFPGETAIISGPGLSSGRMKISHGCSFMDFVGFTITNHNQGLYIDDDAGTSTACHDILVNNITVHDVGQEGIAIREGAGYGGNSNAPMNVTISNSLVFNTGKLGTSQNGEGIYTGNSSGTDTTNTVTIFHNTIHDTQDEAIELKGDSHNITVDGNTIYNCILPGSSFSSTGGCIEIDEPRNTATNPQQLIRNNIIHDVIVSAGITKRALRMGTGTTAYNNLIYNIASGNTCVLSNSSNFPRVFYQNTIDCTTANALVNSGTTLDSQNNLGPTTSGNNRAITSSDFVNYAGHDYRLVTGSPALNVGANLLATVPTDILGVTRMNPPDLGAYEGAFSSGVTCNITAASASQANVTTAINSASSGQTVCVPAGSASWANMVISGKALNLIGAGIGVTNITGGSANFLNMTVGPSNFVRVSGFTFTKGADNSSGNISWDPIGNSASATGVSFRFDHNRVVIPSASSTHFLVPSTVYGLIDHNTFDITATSGSIGVFDPHGSGDGNDLGWTPWLRALTMGTDQAVYFEDNAVNGTTADAGIEDCIDAYTGARFVIRHNTFLNCTVGFHGLDTGGFRAPVSFEIYSNTFTNNSGVTLRGATVRGGTGVFFSNTYNGSGGWGGVTLMLYRVVQPNQVGGWGVCNGTNYRASSSNFSSGITFVTSGGFGFSSTDRETLGTFGSGVFTTFGDGSGSGGYPCRDQPGRGPGQTLQPIYVWNQIGGGGVGTYDGGSGISDANYLQAGRDYFSDNTTQRPGYTPLVYPHPLSTP